MIVNVHILCTVSSRHPSHAVHRGFCSQRWQPETVFFSPVSRVAPYHIFLYVLHTCGCRLGLNGITLTGPSGAEIGGPFLDCRVFFGGLSPAGGRWAASCGGFTVFQLQISKAKSLRVCPSHTRVRNPYSDIRTVKRRVFSIPNTDHYTCRTARSLDWSPAS